MRTIRKTFEKKKTLFIPFIMAGAPSIDMTIQAMCALQEIGADIIELGVPFSDPIADGPINQMAAQIALENNVNLNTCLEIIEKARNLDVHLPIVLFSYFNPILSMGIECFSKKAKRAGANGVLVVDLPIEEGEDFYRVVNAHDLEPVVLIAPTTDLNRFKNINDISPGFIYVISRLGVTGIQDNLASDFSIQMQKLRTTIPNIPLSLGFGISNIAQAKQAAEVADGVIVGSYLVDALQNQGLAAFSQITRELATTIHA